MGRRADDWELTRLVDGLDHPEGVAWDPRGFLVAGGEAGQIYRMEVGDDALGEPRQVTSIEGFCLGIALDADGAAYVCDHVSHAVFRVAQDGETRTYSSGTDRRPMQVPNFPVFDAEGRLYVSDSGTWGQDDGCIFRVDPGGATHEVWSGGGRFSNGLAISPDDAYLYVVETSWPGVVRHAIDGSGALGPREEVTAMPQTVPDGLAFAASGELLISCYRPDGVFIFDGDLRPLVVDWTGLQLSAPTNIAFFGPKLDRLVAANLAASQLTEIPVDLVGASLHLPVGLSG